MSDFAIGDLVETAKGAAFWGKIIGFHAEDTDNPGATVEAVAPGFTGTRHVYPLKQLRLCAGARPALVEAEQRRYFDAGWEKAKLLLTPEDLEAARPAADPVSASTVPDWVADFLNRRTEVEHELRAPMTARRKGQLEPAPITAEEMWELADKLSIPAEFEGAARNG